MAKRDLNVGLVLDTRAFDKALGATQRKLNRFAFQAQSIGRNLTQSFSIPLALAGAAGIKLATDLEASFAKIENLVGITGDTLDSFKTSVKELSGEVGKSQQELSEALFVVTSAGIRGSEAMDVLTQSAKASVVGLGETKDIARTVTAVMQAYAKTGITAAEATDTLTTIVREGNLEATELAGALGSVLPIAAELGVSFQEVGANIAAFTRLGVNSDEASTALKGLLSGLLNPAEQTVKALKGVGLTTQQLRDDIKNNGLASTLNELIAAFDGNVEAIGDVFPNIRALSAVLGTAGAQGEKYIGIVDSITNSTGIVDKAFESASETIQAKFNKALVNLQNVAIDFGNVLLPVVTNVITRINEWSASFARLDESTKKTITKIALFVAAAGPLIFSIGKIVAVGGSLVQLFRLLTSGFASTVNAVSKLGKSFLSLSLGPQVVLFLAVAGAVVAIGVAVQSLIERLGKLGAAQRAVNKIQGEAAKSVATETAQIGPLIRILQDENQQRETKELALKKLQEANAEYFGDLKIEGDEVKGLTKAYDDFQKSILQTAIIKASQAEFTKLGKQVFEIRKQQKKLEEGGNIGFGLVGSRESLIKQGNDEITAIAKQVASIDDIYQDAIASLSKLKTSATDTSDAKVVIDTDGIKIPEFGTPDAIKVTVDTSEIKTAQDVIFDLKTAISSIKDEKIVGLIEDDTPEAIRATETALADLLKIEGPLGVNTQKLAADLETLKGIYKAEIEIKANESVDIDSILRNLDNQLKVIESKKIVGLIGSGVLDSIKVTEKALQDLSVAPGVTSEEIDKLNTKLAEIKSIYEIEVKLSTADLSSADAVLKNLVGKLDLIETKKVKGLISDKAPEQVKAVDDALKAIAKTQGIVGVESLDLSKKLELINGLYEAEISVSKEGIDTTDLKEKLERIQGIYEAEIKLTGADLSTADAIIANLADKFKLIEDQKIEGIISDTVPAQIKATNTAFNAMVIAEGEAGAETLKLKANLESLKGEYTASFNLDIQTGDISEVDTIFEDLQAELDDIELKASISLVDDSEAQKLSALESALYKVAKAAGIDSTDFQNLKAQIDEARNSTNGLSESLQSAFKDIEFNAEIFDVPQLDVLKQKLEAVKTEMQGLSSEENADRLAFLKIIFEELGIAVDDLSKKPFGENFKKGLEEWIESFNVLETTVSGVAAVYKGLEDTIVAGINNEKAAFSSLAKAFVSESGKILKAIATQAVYKYINSVMLKPFPVNVILAAAAGAVVGGLFRAAASRIQVPGLAQGGIIPPGFPNDSYPAFLTSGETVIPPGKLPDFATSGIIAETRINGRDLLIMLRREESSLSRIE